MCTTRTFANKKEDSRFDGTFTTVYRGNWPKGGDKTEFGKGSVVVFRAAAKTSEPTPTSGRVGSTYSPLKTTAETRNCREKLFNCYAFLAGRKLINGLIITDEAVKIYSNIKRMKQ